MQRGGAHLITRHPHRLRHLARPRKRVAQLFAHPQMLLHTSTKNSFYKWLFSGCQQSVNVIFHPYGRKSTVINHYFQSPRTEICKHMYAIFRPQGRKSTAKFRYFPSVLLLFYLPKHYPPLFLYYPKRTLFCILDS